MQSHQSDSNRRPMLYESIALPAELRWQRFWTTEGAAVKQRNRGSVKAVRRVIRGQWGMGSGQWWPRILSAAHSPLAFAP